MYGLETMKRMNDEAWLRHWRNLAESLERLSENHEDVIGELAVEAPAVRDRLLKALDKIGRRRVVKTSLLVGRY